MRLSSFTSDLRMHWPKQAFHLGIRLFTVHLAHIHGYCTIASKWGVLEWFRGRHFTMVAT